MKPVHTFTIIPSLPPELERLRDVAFNLRWSWNHEAIQLFRRLDDDLWERTGHNPVLMLGSISQTALDSAAADPAFLAHLDRVWRDFEAYLQNESTWFQHEHGNLPSPLVAYFSAEFGITECLSIFAGGLGILAGDHLKSASDLGVNLVAVGLLYQQGYFQQYLNEAGWQQEAYEDNDFYNLPINLERTPDGKPLMIKVRMADVDLFVQIWRVQVGRVSLYLLDTNIPENTRPEHRDITDQLYGGDLENRLKQEIVLGIGGYRALEALGLEPPVYHMNEGHSAFLALERVHRLMQKHSLSFNEAAELASAGLVFTTHTPVPAGHDRFPPDMMARYLGHYAEGLKLSMHDFMALGRTNPDDQSQPFGMTTFALSISSYSNGVSRLHGKVTRAMWQELWPNEPQDEIPIGHVTNGVHFRSWISQDMNHLYDRYLGPRWREEPADETVWRRVERIPAEELWRTHERRRERLVSFARRSLRKQLERRGARPSEIEAADEVLDPEALTIGFARRFATYKRATLLFRDPERLARLLNHPDCPVQIVIAGKAHPRDDAGKELIRQIVSLAKRPEFRNRVVFIEDYDMSVARYMVQGADIWLNTPLRPREASGTSGMKAAANGVLNVSTLDGWWDEAWYMVDHRNDPIGWAIGHGESYENPADQDRVEAQALYEILERDVIPTFYDRGSSNLPRRWVSRMKASIGSLCHFFNTHRMVRSYTEHFYLPAAKHFHELADGQVAGARALAAWKKRVRENWPGVKIVSVDSTTNREISLGQEFTVRACVQLAGLDPTDMNVQLYLGQLDADGEIQDAVPIPMRPIEPAENGCFFFETTVSANQKSGLHGFTVRVLPDHPDLVNPFKLGLITWANTDGVRA